MIIVYYTGPDGDIIKHHDMKEDSWSLEEVKKLAKSYNRQKDHHDTAHAEWFPDDSLTAYLFEKAADRAAIRKDDVRYILDTLDSVREAIYDLAL